MKKQIFSFLLALTLILTVIPVAVSAANEEARIGTTLYATLDQALTAAEDGDTVEVLKDCKSKGMTISKNITVKGMDGLETKPMVTFESSQKPTESGMVPGKDTSLTFENLRFYSTQNVFSFAAASAGSTLTLKNCDVESEGYYCVFINAHGITLNVVGGNYSSDYGVINFGSAMPQTDERIIVNVTGATMTETAHLNNQYAVISNNNGKSNVEIHITDSVLNAEAPQDAPNGSCIKIGGYPGEKNIAANNVLTVKNSTLNSNAQFGIYVERTTKTDITIEDSTLNLNSTEAGGSCIKIGGNSGEKNIAANNVLTVKNSTLNSNAQFGIYVERTTKTDITIEDSTLNLNSTEAGGACIKAGGGNGTVEKVTLTVKGNKTQLNTKSQYCVYYQKTLNSTINLEGGKLTVEDAGQSFAWAVSTYKTPENARAKVTVSGAEIDTVKAALDLDANTDFSITAGKLNEDKSTLSFGGKKQTMQGNPFPETLYAQYLKGTTVESASTNVRFAMQVPTEGYERYGFLVSVGNRILLVGLANGEKILSVETATLYTAVYANGEKVGTDAEGCGWLALGIDGIPQADFGTEFSVRPYAVKDGTVLLGKTYTFTVNGLLSK